MKANIDKFYLITSKQSCVNLKISDMKTGLVKNY